MGLGSWIGFGGTGGGVGGVRGAWGESPGGLEGLRGLGSLRWVGGSGGPGRGRCVVPGGGFGGSWSPWGGSPEVALGRFWGSSSSFPPRPFQRCSRAPAPGAKKRNKKPFFVQKSGVCLQSGKGAGRSAVGGGASEGRGPTGGPSWAATRLRLRLPAATSGCAPLPSGVRLGTVPPRNAEPWSLRPTRSAGRCRTGTKWRPPPAGATCGSGQRPAPSKVWGSRRGVGGPGDGRGAGRGARGFSVGAAGTALAGCCECSGPAGSSGGVVVGRGLPAGGGGALGGPFCLRRGTLCLLAGGVCVYLSS